MAVAIDPFSQKGFGWDTVAKGRVRELVMRQLPLAVRSDGSRFQFARTALSLPGAKLLCLQQGYAGGLYREQTQHVLVERVEKQRKRLQARLKSQWWTIKGVHGEDLDRLNLLQSFEHQPVDWAYLDLCAAMNRNTAWWVRHRLGQSLAVGAAVAVTVSRNWRHNLFMSRAVELLRNTRRGRRLMREVRQELSLRDHVYQLHTAEPIHSSSVEAVAVFRLLLPEHAGAVDMCVEYERDSTRHCHRMTTFRVRDLKPARNAEHLRSLADELAAVCQPPSLLTS